MPTYERPADASDSWAADAMRGHLAGIRIIVKGDFGSDQNVDGAFGGVQGHDILIDRGDKDLILHGPDIEAIVIPAERIDHSDELRG